MAFHPVIRARRRNHDISNSQVKGRVALHGDALLDGARNLLIDPFRGHVPSALMENKLARHAPCFHLEGNLSVYSFQEKFLLAFRK